MKTKIIADDRNKNLMVLDTENESISNKPTMFDYYDGWSFSNQNVGIALYVNKETDVGIVRVYSNIERDNNEYVYLYDKHGEMKIDESHFYDIDEHLDLIIEQAEQNDITVAECAEFIVQLNGIHTKEDAEDFLNEDGNWSLNIMRKNILANKQFHTVMNEYLDRLASLSGQEAYDEAHKQAHDAGIRSSDSTREFLKDCKNEEQKKRIEFHAKTSYDKAYAETYDSVISDTQEAHTKRPIAEAV